MPITKTYLNNKTVAQVRGLAMQRGISAGSTRNPKTKSKLISEILRYEAVKKKSTGGTYGSLKMANKNIYLVIHKRKGKQTMVSLKTKSEHDKMVKKFKADGFKKVPLHTFIKK